VRNSEAFGPLAAALQEAEARGLPVETALPRLVRGRTFEDADDVAAVLHGRVQRWLQSAGTPRTRAANLIAGLVPRATNISDPDMARGLWERDQAMERRGVDTRGAGDLCCAAVDPVAWASTRP
jgi:hypothetical protein